MCTEEELVNAKMCMYARVVPIVKAWLVRARSPQRSKQPVKATCFATRSSHSSYFSKPHHIQCRTLPNGDNVSAAYRSSMIMAHLAMNRPFAGDKITVPRAEKHAYPS